MSTIKVNCIDTALAFENTPIITSGGMEENFISFSFCKLWYGYARTAVFWRNEADAYHVRLDAANTCQIPPEVTGDEGTIYFGVFGVNSAYKQRTSQVLTYHVEKGVITMGTAPSDPTPDIYTQFIAAARAFEEKITEIVVDNTIPDGTLTTVKMADEIVTTEKMVDKSITTEKLADKSITTEKLADKIITAEKMAVGAVTAESLTEAAILRTLSKGLQMASGSYEGTGDHGAANPNSLTFDFEPEFVVIFQNGGAAVGGVFFRGSTTYSFIGWTNGTLWADFFATWNEKTLSWYAEEDSDQPYGASFQLNNGGRKYYYFAFGRGV